MGLATNDGNHGAASPRKIQLCETRDASQSRSNGFPGENRQDQKERERENLSRSDTRSRKSNFVYREIDDIVLLTTFGPPCRIEFEAVILQLFSYNDAKFDDNVLSRKLVGDRGKRGKENFSRPREKDSSFVITISSSNEQARVETRKILFRRCCFFTKDRGNWTARGRLEFLCTTPASERIRYLSALLGSFFRAPQKEYNRFRLLFLFLLLSPLLPREWQLFAIFQSFSSQSISN